LIVGKVGKGVTFLLESFEPPASVWR